jgi:hypothetical protein
MVDDKLGCVFVAAFLHLNHAVLEIAIGVLQPTDDEAVAQMAKEDTQ